MLLSLPQRIKKRIRQRDRQTSLFRRDGKRGNAKAAKRHARAVRYLRSLVKKRQRLSPNFHVAEFNCKDGTPVPKESYEALQHLCLTYLEPLRARFGRVRVTSGFRPAPYNRAIGGASESMHIYDFPGRDFEVVAADVVCERGTPQEWADFLEQFKPGGLCPYPSSGFCHVDNRQRAGLLPARWSI